MNVNPITVIKTIISYINTEFCVGDYADLEDHVFTGPNEELENKADKYFVCIFWNFDQGVYELGDSQTFTTINMIIRAGRRTDVMDTTGEKEDFDEFKFDIANAIRSRSFREYMAAEGIKTPSVHIGTISDLPMELTREGLRVGLIPISLISYEDTST